MLRTMSEGSVCQLLQEPKTTNSAALSVLSVPLKGLRHVRLVAMLNQAATHATVLTPKLSTDAAGTSADVITEEVVIYASADVGTAMPTKQTIATTYTVDAAVQPQIVIFEVDPSVVVLSTAADHVYLGLYWSSSSESTNFITVLAICEPVHALQSPLALYS